MSAVFTDSQCQDSLNNSTMEDLMGIGDSIMLALLATAQGVPVDVGRFKPTDFPNLIKLDRQLPHPEIPIGSRKCSTEASARLQVTHLESLI